MKKKKEILEETESLPDVVVKKEKGIPLVWLIPIVAAVIGISLAYKTITEKGPTIKIPSAVTTHKVRRRPWQATSPSRCSGRSC